MNPASHPRLIAVASGKGGVGKTWFAITLAHALARARQRVLLFDGDLGLANVDIQLGLLPEADLSAVVTGLTPLADAARPYPPGGFDILPGRSGTGALAALPSATFERVLAGLIGLGERYDIVLLDLGAGLDRSTRRMAGTADTLLVLATEEPASLTDAYAVLKLNTADHGTADARVVVNQAASRAAGDRTYGTLLGACRNFLGIAPPLAGVVRRDDRVREAIRRQSLLLSRHPASQAGADVEAMVAGLLAPYEPPRHPPLGSHRPIANQAHA
ncbi:MAG: MinD/ParA family protein [Acetobacteraceae bacterium]